jgi:hypothetical protein
MGKSLSLDIRERVVFWLRLGTLVMRRLDGCAFRPPAQSGSCSVGDAQVLLRRPVRADPDRASWMWSRVFLKGRSTLLPT